MTYKLTDIMFFNYYDSVRKFKVTTDIKYRSDTLSSESRRLVAVLLLNTNTDDEVLLAE